jgi:hypothetical protein
MKRVLLKKKFWKKILSMVYPTHFDFYFLNQSSVTFLKINLKI